MVNLKQPSFITPTITIGGVVTVATPLQVGVLVYDFDYVNPTGTIIKYSPPNKPFNVRLKHPYIKDGVECQFTMRYEDTVSGDRREELVTVGYQSNGILIPTSLTVDEKLTVTVYIPDYKSYSDTKSIDTYIPLILRTNNPTTDVIGSESLSIHQLSFDLYDYAYANIANIDSPRIRFINPRQVIIGQDNRVVTSLDASPALNVTDKWSSDFRLEISNDGWIFGRGGNGWSQPARSQNGGVGINGGNVPMRVYNAGVISGGGGGGGHDAAYHDGGGGGAPYGIGGYGSRYRASNATLTIPGRLIGWNTHVGGEIGKRGSEYGWDDTQPGEAGLTYTGDVEIINIGTGHTGYL